MVVCWHFVGKPKCMQQTQFEFVTLRCWRVGMSGNQPPRLWQRRATSSYACEIFVEAAFSFLKQSYYCERFEKQRLETSSKRTSWRESPDRRVATPNVQAIRRATSCATRGLRLTPLMERGLELQVTITKEDALAIETPCNAKKHPKTQF